jgi:galactonate dehydratase
MNRRAFIGGVAAYGSLLADARAQGTSRAPKLKIREIRAARMRGINSRFVRVYTDQGLTGTGETLDTIGAEDIINKFLGPGLVGRDPLEIESIYFDMYSFRSVPGGIPPVFMRGAGGGPYIAALSGIEIALWDLAGKALGLPVYRLMGGKLRDKVPVYFHSNDPQDAADLVRGSGVRGIKALVDSVTEGDNNARGWDPGKVWNWTLTNGQIDDIAHHVASMREALGPDVGLMLECHTRYDTESAIQIAKALEPYRPMWIEEPVPSDNVDAMAAVRNHARVPIACGENVYSRFGFRPFLEKQAVSIIQPDMAKCGGLWEGRKIAAMAEVYHIPIAPHGVATNLGEVAYAHVCSTVPNLMILEWMHFRDKAYAELTTAPNYSGDGFLHVPNTPGIGIEVHDHVVNELLLPGYPAL